MSIFDGKYFLILFLFHFRVSVRADIILSPKDTEASVGENVTIYCSTSSGICDWYHRPIGAKQQELVYREGFTYNGYKERFNVTEKEDKACNLLITNVRVIDAGLFTCKEVSNIQTEKKAELIVFEKYPSNELCASKLICNPSCIYELSCIMKSYGNIRPFMECKDSRGNLANLTTDSTLSVIQVNDEDLSLDLNYTCYVKYPNNSLSSKLHWSYSPPVYLEYKHYDKTKEFILGTAIGFYSLRIYAIISTTIIIGIILLFCYWKRTKALRHVELNAIEKGSTNGKETDGEETDGKETDGEETDGKETDGKETDGKETDGKETDAYQLLSWKTG